MVADGEPMWKKKGEARTVEPSGLPATASSKAKATEPDKRPGKIKFLHVIFRHHHLSPARNSHIAPLPPTTHSRAVSR
jgi:hypothetical protein